jgi:hypothetical protein
VALARSPVHDGESPWHDRTAPGRGSRRKATNRALSGLSLLDDGLPLPSPVR